MKSLLKYIYIIGRDTMTTTDEYYQWRPHCLPLLAAPCIPQIFLFFFLNRSRDRVCVLTLHTSLLIPFFLYTKKHEIRQNLLFAGLFSPFSLFLYASQQLIQNLKYFVFIYFFSNFFSSFFSNNNKVYNKYNRFFLILINWLLFHLFLLKLALDSNNKIREAVLERRVERTIEKKINR